MKFYEEGYTRKTRLISNVSQPIKVVVLVHVLVLGVVSVVLAVLVVVVVNVVFVDDVIICD